MKKSKKMKVEGAFVESLRRTPSARRRHERTWTDENDEPQAFTDGGVHAWLFGDVAGRRSQRRDGDGDDRTFPSLDPSRRHPPLDGRRNVDVFGPLGRRRWGDCCDCTGWRGDCRGTGGRGRTRVERGAQRHVHAHAHDLHEWRGGQGRDSRVRRDGPRRALRRGGMSRAGCRRAASTRG